MGTHLKRLVPGWCPQHPCNGGGSGVSHWKSWAKGTADAVMLLFIFFYWGLERVYLAGTEVSVYIWWTKIISSSEKHCIGNIKRKQGPLIISISARTRDSIHGRSRDFSGAKEIFPWLPVHPVMGKGEGGVSNVQFSDVYLQGERQLNGDVRTCLVSQGNSLLYVYLACVDIWKLFWATTANLIHGLFSLQSIVP